MASVTSPEAVRKPESEAPIVAEVREYLARLKFYADPSPHELAVRLGEDSRELAMYRAPIGKSAISIGDALDDLIERVEEHLKNWPDDKAAREAAITAVEAAGIEMPEGYLQRTHGGALQFNYMAGELETWLPMLRMMSERLDSCAPPSIQIEREEV